MLGCDLVGVITIDNVQHHSPCLVWLTSTLSSLYNYIHTNMQHIRQPATLTHLIHSHMHAQSRLFWELDLSSSQPGLEVLQARAIDNIRRQLIPPPDVVWEKTTFI